MVIQFSDQELFDMFNLARKRNKDKPQWRKRGGSPLDLHYKGLLAELAVAKALNISINTEIYGEQGDGGKPDLHLPSGESIEVKFRSKRGWDFALDSTRPESFRADYGILVWPVEGSDDSVEIVGYLSKEQFLQRYSIVDYSWGDRMAVSGESMIPLSELIKEIQGGITETPVPQGTENSS